MRVSSRASKSTMMPRLKREVSESRVALYRMGLASFDESLFQFENPLPYEQPCFQLLGIHGFDEIIAGAASSPVRYLAWSLSRSSAQYGHKAARGIADSRHIRGSPVRLAQRAARFGGIRPGLILPPPDAHSPRAVHFISGTLQFSFSNWRGYAHRPR